MRLSCVVEMYRQRTTLKTTSWQVVGRSPCNKRDRPVASPLQSVAFLRKMPVVTIMAPVSVVQLYEITG